MSSIGFMLNGVAAQLVAKDAAMPLLYALRNELGLTAAKFGCGLGQCGACTVIMDGSPVRSCSVPVAAVAGCHVETLEGLARDGRPHPVQQAFIDEQALQCGYCTGGMVMAAKALLDRNHAPSEAEIVDALEGHLCRCGTQQRVMRAVRRAAARLRD